MRAVRVSGDILARSGESSDVPSEHAQHTHEHTHVISIALVCLRP
jgi:hypothetical protein